MQLQETCFNCHRLNQNSNAQAPHALRESSSSCQLLNFLTNEIDIVAAYWHWSCKSCGAEIALKNGTHILRAGIEFKPHHGKVRRYQVHSCLLKWILWSILNFTCRALFFLLAFSELRNFLHCNVRKNTTA